MESMIGMKLRNIETGELVWIKHVNNPLEWAFPITVGNAPGNSYTGWRESIQTLRDEYVIVRD